ncbi:MAG: phosphodiester glycosidase family protein [Clostridia bacterium]|nr:phosphodiester glycosidase family protein [Clostridia bacterium]
MPGKSRKIIFFIFVTILVSSIFQYAGHFLFEEKAGQKAEDIHPKSDRKVQESNPEKMPVQFRKLSMQLNGNKQEVNVLEIDLKEGKAEVKPVLSLDSIFGFEKLSAMVQRTAAYAAINGGFFFDNGQPGGMVAIDGKLLQEPTGRFPVFIVENGKARFEEVKQTRVLRVRDKGIEIEHINTLGESGQVILYTPEFGTDTRLKAKNTSVVIKDNIVQEIGEFTDKCDIPKDGMVLSFIHPMKENFSSLPIHKNDSVKIEIQPGLQEKSQAYECGSWVVKEGQNVAGIKDDWVGLLTNPDPRTALAVKADGTVMLVTVDGRQPGYSTGVTGKELGSILLQLGAKDAAMLDGGASTEMIVEGKIVNRPSYKGEERLLGGAIIVKLK